MDFRKTVEKSKQGVRSGDGEDFNIQNVFWW